MVTLRVGGENPNLDAVSEFIKSLFPGAVLKVRTYLNVKTFVTNFLSSHLPAIPACLFVWRPT